MNKDNVINIEFFRDDSIKITFSDSKNYTYDRGYQNSLSGRTQLQTDCDTETVAEVFAVWGDTPTEEDFVLPDLPTVKPQPTAEQLAIAELSVAQAIAQQQNEMAIAELSIMIAGGMNNV